MDPLPDAPHRYRLSAFEHYMLADDHPDCPMVIALRTRWRGAWDPAPWQRTLGPALRHQPLLTARLAADRRHWHRTDAVPPLETIDGPPTLPAWNLTVDRGLRVLVHPDAGHTDLWILVHHALTDGLGLLAFLGQWIADCAGTTVRPQRPDARLLAQRRRLGLSWRQLLALVQRQGQALRSLGRLLWRPARAAGALGPTGPSGPIRFHRCTLSPSLTAAVRQAARRLDVTLNDLLLASLFWTLRRLHPQHSAHPWRVCVPVNFRQSHHEAAPASNWISLAFLERRDHQITQRRALLRSVRRETQRLKRRREAVTFHAGLAWMHRWGRLGPHCGRATCRTTAVLSNLGPIFENHPCVGPDGRIRLRNLTLTSLDLLVPRRPRTHLALAALTYARSLHLTLHYDPSAVGDRRADELLGRLVEDLTQWIPAEAPEPRH